jgi:hypothetical protein
MKKLIPLLTIIFLLSCPTTAFLACSGCSGCSGLSPETEELKAVFGHGKDLATLDGIVPEMNRALDTIDQGIGSIPTVYVKIKIVQAHIVNITKKMGEWRPLKISEQEEKIATSIKDIIKPLEQFLNLIQTFSFVIKPLMTGSLVVFAQDRAWLDHIETLEDSILWNAFTADSDIQNKKDVVTFLTENVTKIDDFKILLKELVTLFGDLLASLSDETIAKGLEAQAKLQAQKTAPKPATK